MRYGDRKSLQWTRPALTRSNRRLLSATLVVAIGIVAFGVFQKSPSTSSAPFPDWPQIPKLPPVPPRASGISATEAAALLRSTVGLQGKNCDGLHSGSGWVIGTDLIATNGHVVFDTGDIKVTFNDGSRPRVGFVVAYDPSSDAALVRVPNLRRTPLHVSNAKAGASGVSFGHSGHGYGILTLKDPTLRPRQVATDDVQVHPLTVFSGGTFPGDSGAAIVDRAGDVIGMVEAGNGAVDPDPTTRETFAVSPSELRKVLGQARTRTVPDGSCGDHGTVGPLAASECVAGSEVAKALGEPAYHLDQPTPPNGLTEVNVCRYSAPGLGEASLQFLAPDQSDSNWFYTPRVGRTGAEPAGAGEDGWCSPSVATKERASGSPREEVERIDDFIAECSTTIRGYRYGVTYTGPGSDITDQHWFERLSSLLDLEIAAHPAH